MQNLHYSIHINASREKVWNTMLEDTTYREWTGAFMPGSYYQGNWSEGSKILFLGPGKEGEKEGGIAAIVKENRPHEYISLENYAEVQDGTEMPWDQTWFENYTFTDVEGGTALSIDLTNIKDEYVQMFNDMWPKALQALKEVVEK